VLALVATTIGLTACGSSDTQSDGSSVSIATTVPKDAPADPVKLSIATQPWIGYGPWYIAKAKGYDLKNGVDFSFTSFTENKDLYAAVGSGRIDSTEALVSSALRFQAANIPLKVVLFQDVSTTADAIIAGPGIDSAADLKGKRVGFEEGGGHEMLLRLALQKAGLTIDDITKVPLTPDTAGAALISGKIDAAVTYEPYISQALQKKPGTKIIVPAGDFPGIISDVWAVTDKFAEEHPEAVVGALKAWNEGVEFYRSHPKEALEIIGKAIKTPASQLEVIAKGVKLSSAVDSREFFQKEFQPLASETLKIMKDQGSLDGEADPTTLVDSSYLDKVG
jgi:NitT/TauT family transport system substrate-binding protein